MEDDNSDPYRNPPAKRFSSNVGPVGFLTKRTRVTGAGHNDVQEVASPSGKYDVSASLYFDDYRFFAKKESFKKIVNSFQATTVQDLYMKALETCRTDLQRAFFFSDNLHGCNLQVVLEDFKKWDVENSLGNTHSTNHVAETQYTRVPKESCDEKGKREALNFGIDFVASIMRDIEQIPGSRGIRVLRQIPSLDFNGKYDLILRSITQPFWEECIREVSTPDMFIRVCAVGTPGIGKTGSIPFLIRMLLKDNHIVVYRRLSDDYFWEFTWKNNDEGYDVTVHRAETHLSEVDSLKETSTFYIVDPGSTRSNCAPDTKFKARTIIVASPNEDNWGSTNFDKTRGNADGEFKYFPMWELEDLLEARLHLSSPPPSEEKILERFRLVGGVLRHI